MRSLLAAAGLVLLLALPGGMAHNGLGFPHVNPQRLDLAPDVTTPVELAFVESMGFQQGDANATGFEAGALFALSIVPPANGSVEVALRRGHDQAPGDLVRNWTASGSATQVLGARLPANDTYTLWFHNPGQASVSTQFFYDQSCNCAGKPIPSEIPHGLVIFNADTFHAGWLHAQVFEPPALHAKVGVGTLEPGGAWPQDFHELAESAAGRAVPGAQGRVHDFNVTSTGPTRFYFLAQGVSVDASALPRDPQQRVDALMLTPSFETGTGGPPAKTPLPALLPLLGLGLAALVLRRR
ncbi:MAG: hypothetical protein LC624_06960 [Halobacteriales archaeon]|nr:hypothetical protein [Halobacteriales archaeon]